MKKAERDIRNREILAGYMSGDSTNTLADKHKLCTQQIRFILRKQGVGEKRRQRNHRDNICWTPEEDQFVRDNYQAMTDGRIGIRLGRTLDGVVYRRKQLGIMRERWEFKWDDKAENYLVDNYKNLTDREMAEKLGITMVAVSGKRKREGLIKSWRGSMKPAEHIARDDFILNNYQKMTDTEIGRYFNISGSAVKQRRYKLGLLKNNRVTNYTQDDALYIFQLISEEGKSVEAISRELKIDRRIIKHLVESIGEDYNELIVKKRNLKRKTLILRYGYYQRRLIDVPPEHRDIVKAMVSAGEIPEHRYQMAVHLDRPLKKGKEIVHHINGNGLDNRLRNLVVLSRQDHNEFHRVDQAIGTLKAISSITLCKIIYRRFRYSVIKYLIARRVK